MKFFRADNRSIVTLVILLITALGAVVLGVSGLFHNIEWLVLIGLALFLLAGAPLLRELTRPAQTREVHLGGSLPNRRISNRVIAISSAAILAVYAAGYDRTSTAADQMEHPTAASRRHPTPSAAAGMIPGEVALQPVVTPPIAVALPKIDSDTPRNTASPAVSIVVPRSPSAPLSVVAVPATTLAPTAVETAAAAELPAADKRPAESVLAPPEQQTAYHDGTFLGWGLCRHGAIQVEVVIQAGRIASANIAQCLTRYSCTVIKNAPPQLVSRQNPDAIDNVTGATQSINAYYEAVLDALNDASKPPK